MLLILFSLSSDTEIRPVALMVKSGLGLGFQDQISIEALQLHHKSLSNHSCAASWKSIKELAVDGNINVFYMTIKFAKETSEKDTSSQFGNKNSQLN